MPAKQPVSFGFMISAVDEIGASDRTAYDLMVQDARFGQQLGYDAAWMVEHHFSDYFPQPSPLVMLSHIAGQCPGLGLGTMVLVTPWHNPLRLAGEIAMLSLIAKGDLHFGLGRGNAPLEYEAFGVKMGEAKQRFEEVWRILDLALSGKPFTFAGKHLQVPREVRIRPQPDLSRTTFYGAIGNPASATKIAELGLPPISNGTLPFDIQVQVLKTWNDVAERRGMRTDVLKPVSISCFIADTDREADAMARELLPPWFKLQVEHYRHDAERHHDLPDYQPFAQTHARRVMLTDPKNLDPFLDVSLVGSPETVRRRVQRYVDIGFNHIILQVATPGIPQRLRHLWMTRFAKEVAPHFTGEATRGAERTPAAVGA
ncbi:MAG: LLM class flavin-dependent oxidoreductase [Rhodospirillaceae bacterium]|nr:LLM class flavin-dependent oxidoreductase [Rhodospirillaceae bacterium]